MDLSLAPDTSATVIWDVKEIRDFLLPILEEIMYTQGFVDKPTNIVLSASRYQEQNLSHVHCFTFHFTINCKFKH